MVVPAAGADTETSKDLHVGCQMAKLLSHGWIKRAFVGQPDKYTCKHQICKQAFQAERSGSQAPGATEQLETDWTWPRQWLPGIQEGAGSRLWGEALTVQSHRGPQVGIDTVRPTYYCEKDSP